MILKQKIGVIGNGFVGGAVKFGFSPQTGCEADVRVYDIEPSKSTHTLEETVNESDFRFLSVPTPANKDGSINIDILEMALYDIENAHNGVKENSYVNKLSDSKIHVILDEGKRNDYTKIIRKIKDIFK